MALADKQKIWSRAQQDPRIGMLLYSLVALLVAIASYLAGVPASAATMAGLATLMAVCWVTACTCSSPTADVVAWWCER